MVEKAAGGANSSATLESFSGYLIGQIESGSYASQKASWVGCVNVKTAQTCALQWYVLPLFRFISTFGVWSLMARC